MRISGGKLAGRAVQVPPGIIRPAMEKMRESVFAVLGDLSGLSFLDLFSGSGVIALEAASRGAAFIEAVESDRKKRAKLIQNVSLSPTRINCRFMAVELYIKRTKRTFDIVFCDPPFPYQFKSQLLLSLAASPLVSFETLVLIHHPRTETMAVSPLLTLRETRFYGNSAYSLIPEIFPALRTRP